MNDVDVDYDVGLPMLAILLMTMIIITMMMFTMMILTMMLFKMMMLTLMILKMMLFTMMMLTRRVVRGRGRQGRMLPRLAEIALQCFEQ